MEKEERKDIFVELAKVKSQPTSLKITEKNSSEDGSADEGEGTLTVDVYQDGDYVVVESTVAGVNDNDLEVNITTESVTIKGTRERKKEIEDKDYFYQELFWGTFSRSIILPHEVDPEESVATLKNGVLTIKMPRLNRQKTKKLKVKTAD